MAEGKHVVTRRTRPARRPASSPAVRRSGVAGRLGVAHASPALLQPALKVGAANDPMEREAEAMAERVVAMPAPQLAAPDAATAAAATPDAQRASVDDQPSTEELETVPPIPEDHLDPEVPPTEDVNTEALTGAEMTELETGEPVDTSGDPPLETSAAPAGAEAAQPARNDDAAVVGAEGGAAPADVSARVAQPGPGRPLPASVRAFMEPRFGRDFSAVRLHDAPEDRRAAARIGARAFTNREHIWMGPGESAEDRKLLAHELTHVVQQTAPTPARALRRTEAVETTPERDEPKVRRGYLRNKAEKYARNVPGYRLICLIIGRSPITGDTVERNAVNVLGALMSLIPGGNLLFERLEESRVLEEAFDWVWARLQSLNITWTRIKGLISDLLDYLPDWPSDVIDYAKKLFRPLVNDIITFIGDVTQKILEFIVRGALKLAGPWAERVWEIIKAAGSVLIDILKDPLGFAKNLFAAVLKGFNQFGGNIVTHIKKGLLGWLFGAMRGLDIEIPERLDFKGLISIGLQIVGLTYANFREILVKRLGENGERKVRFLEKSVEVVKILRKEGFIGLWQRVLQMIDNFKQMVVDGIQNFVIDSLIMGGLSWLAGLSNPVGAIIKVVLAIYNLIKTFLERLDQILDVAKAIFSSIGAIAAGRIQDAADFIERTLAATIPVVISFLAALVPVTGITNAIRNIISKLRTAVNNAIEKMVIFIAKKAKKLFSKLIEKLNSKRELPSFNFTIGKTAHRLYAKYTGKKVDVFVQSDEQTSDDALKYMKEQIPEFKTKASEETLKEVIAFINTFQTEETDAEKKANKVDLKSKKKPPLKDIEALKAELKQGSERLTQFGLSLADNGDVMTTDPRCLVRFQRSEYEQEGKAGTYKDLFDLMKGQKYNGAEASSFFEKDHIPGVAPLRILEKVSEQLNAGKAGAPTPIRAGQPDKAAKDDPKASKQPLGGFHTRGLGDPARSFRAIVVDRKFNLRGAKTQDTAAFEQAAKKPTPAARKRAAEKAIADHVNARVEQLAAEYAKNESEPTRKRIEEGLGQIKQFAKEDFGLPENFATEAPEIPEPVPGTAQSQSVPFADSANAGVRNFAEGEGRAGNYVATREAYKNDYLVFDHVMDRSFVKTVKDWTTKDIWGPAIDAAAGADREAKSRAKEVGRKKIFDSGSLASYDENTSLAVGIFRRVNDVVASHAGEVRGDEAASTLRGKVSKASLDRVKRFVKTGKASAEEALDGSKKEIRAALDARFDVHSSVIESAYQNEKVEVAKLNTDPPAKKDAAEAQMNLIVARLKLSLEKMRTEKNGLFA